MGGWLVDTEELEAKKESLAPVWVRYYPSAFFPFYRNSPQTQGPETEPVPSLSWALAPLPLSDEESGPKVLLT